MEPPGGIGGLEEEEGEKDVEDKTEKSIYAITVKKTIEKTVKKIVKKIVKNNKTEQKQIYVTPHKKDKI